MKIFFTFIIALFLASCIQRPHALDLLTKENADSAKMTPMEIPLNEDNLISFDVKGVPDTNLSSQQIAMSNKQLYGRAKKCFALVGKDYPIMLNKADSIKQTLSGSGTQAIDFNHNKLLINYTIAITIHNGVSDLIISDFYLKDGKEDLSVIYRNYLKGNYKINTSETKQQAKKRYDEIFNTVRKKAFNLFEAFTFYEATEIIPDTYKEY